MNRIRSYWRTPKPFSASQYRGLVMGLDIGHIMTQIAVYLMLERSVRTSELPYWTLDLVIIFLSLLTALSTPYFSWLGFQRRRRTMLIWAAVASCAIVLICFTSFIPKTVVDYCKRSLPSSVTSSPTLRLVLLLIIIVVVTVGGNASWCHGIAYIDENAEDTATQYGLLVCVRVLGYWMQYPVVSQLIASGSMWIKMLILNAVYFVHYVRLLKAPKEIQNIDLNGTGFFPSLSRVITNKLVMAQIVSMSLLVAGFWGAVYFRQDIIKTSYLFVEPEHSFMYMYASILYYHLLVLIIIYVGMNYSKPLMLVFNKQSALKLSTFASVSLFGIYIAMSFITCEKGPIAGLSAKEFVPPLCSGHCRCSDLLEVNPVCVFEDMVTYLSPCHAGCTGMENLHGIDVVANCSCAAGKRAAVGACAANSCSLARSLHAAAWLFVVIFFCVAVMLQLKSILRAADVRDRSVALGAGMTVVATVGFLAAHVAYTAVSYNNCVWSDNRICKLHNSKFPYITYFMSGAFSLLSAILSFTTFLLLKKSGYGVKQPIPNGDANANEIRLSAVTSD